MSDLRALAENARPETKGRWRYRRCDFGHRPHSNYSYVEWGEPDRGMGTAALSIPMARYIAAVDPQTVLRLLAVVEAAARCMENVDTAMTVNDEPLWDFLGEAITPDFTALRTALSSLEESR